MTETPDFNTLSESEKRIVAERLLTIKESGWKPFWCPVADCDGMPHWAIDKDGNSFFVSETEVQGPLGQPVGERVYESADGEWYAIEDGEEPDEGDVCMGRPILDPVWAHNHAREDQRLLPWNEKWTLFIMSGRGSGKTRTGVEFVTLCARKGLDGSKHTPITYLFSAEKPENIRSVNLSYAWVDEAAFMDEIETAWMNLKLATRVKSPGNPIHMLITSTPTGSKWVQKMEDDDNVEVRRVSTYANRANLDPDWIADLEKEYEGTRMG